MLAYRLASSFLGRNTTRLYSSSHGLGSLPPVDCMRSQLHNAEINVFRERAFIPQRPLLITERQNSDLPSHGTVSTCSIPAASKWFSTITKPGKTPVVTISQYLSSFRHNTSLPYELLEGNRVDSDGLTGLLDQSLEQAPSIRLQRFHAPLSVFLQAMEMRHRPSIYIAQAQLSDLPKQLQGDLPTPYLVKEAGKGDVYDANLWMGIPPTYTPLHKDPNPNLFVQLASSKRIRLFNPVVGAAIFRHVQSTLGGSASATFRGNEMMEGPERAALDEAVWGKVLSRQGFEATVSPGDALFIPKGWWHTIKSIGPDINASVNWWFR